MLARRHSPPPLTVAAQEVVEELKEREAAPGVAGLRLQAGVHVGAVQRQEGFGVLRHQLGPPGEGLETPQKKKIRGCRPRVGVLAKADLEGERR